ncbi:SURF1 family protein [Sphingomonas sp.]|uniref:SURF1 family protein n=1 Tax=Sphingomonas sp. TaxID=28214 RepID=UPI00286B68AD|nr:SURF1 family protein [Sphingomonas sp.]
MIRKLPLIPTLIVAAAVAVMIALGFWQIRRAHEKEALIARYQAAQSMPPIAFPTSPLDTDDLPLFRHATGLCLKVANMRATAGSNLAGEPGFAQVADCVTGAEGPGMSVELGWSKNPNAAVQWRGGLVSGIIAPDRKSRLRLVAASAPAGLEASAPPSIDQIPNNHRAYAVQWFLFALIAAVIYFLAVRKRLQEPKP